MPPTPSDQPRRSCATTAPDARGTAATASASRARQQAPPGGGSVDMRAHRRPVSFIRTSTQFPRGSRWGAGSVWQHAHDDGHEQDEGERPQDQSHACPPRCDGTMSAGGRGSVRPAIRRAAADGGPHGSRHRRELPTGPATICGVVVESMRSSRTLSSTATSSVSRSCSTVVSFSRCGPGRRLCRPVHWTCLLAIWMERVEPVEMTVTRWKCFGGGPTSLSPRQRSPTSEHHGHGRAARLASVPPRQHTGASSPFAEGQARRPAVITPWRA